MFPYKKHFLTALLMCGLLGLSACDSGDDDNGINGPLQQGQGHVAVSGALTSNYTGQAFWTIEEDDEDDPVFAVFVLRGTLATFSDDNFEFVSIFGGTSRPAVGQYSLTEGAFAGMYVNSMNDNDRIAWSVSGSLQITTSTSSRIVGTTTFTGPLFTATGGTAGNVTVQSNFDALFLDPDDFPEVADYARAEIQRQRALR